jgi:O-antigen ligase
MKLVEASPLTLLFGCGWGMTFENPAVGNLSVNYTHSLFSALLLKTGLVGVGLTLLYIGALVRRAWPVWARNPVLMLALLAPLGIGFLLYASYKCLGFGLLLILLANQRPAENVEKNQ